jgi:hypothetical protein
MTPVRIHGPVVAEHLHAQRFPFKRPDPVFIEIPGVLIGLVTPRAPTPYPSDRRLCSISDVICLSSFSWVVSRASTCEAMRPPEEASRRRHDLSVAGLRSSFRRSSDAQGQALTTCKA